MAKKEQKAEAIDLIKGKFAQAEVMIVTDYRGLTVAQMADLRKKLREKGIEYRVVKNTLASFAAADTGKPALSELLKGPTAIAFGHDDVSQPAKILLEYERSSQGVLSVRGGMLGDKLMTNEDVLALSKLPPKEELIAKVVGQIQSPIYGLLAVLNGNLRGLVGVLQARSKQLA